MTWGESPTSDDKLWGLVAHLSAFVGWMGLGALLMYLVFKDKPYIRYHAVQSGVVQIAIWIIGTVTCGLGFILFLVPIWGAYKAYQGDWDGYPVISGVGR